MRWFPGIKELNNLENFIKSKVVFNEMQQLIIIRFLKKNIVRLRSFVVVYDRKDITTEVSRIK
jgi:hypothetical protein